jgi:CheY-like chemotaxis protein
MQNDYIHIIIADDDEDDRLFFNDAFEELKMNTKVITFVDGIELMEYLNTSEAILPQVLFLDLNMPKKKWD